MAFAWTEISITVANREQKLANVTGIIADGEDIRTFSLPNFNVNAKPARPLAAILAEAVAGLNAKFEQDVADRAKQANLETTLSGWESAMLTACNEGLEQ